MLHGGLHRLSSASDRKLIRSSLGRIAAGLPYAEVHISNFHCVLSNVAEGFITGFGMHSYILGLEGDVEILRGLDGARTEMSGWFHSIPVAWMAFLVSPISSCEIEFIEGKTGRSGRAVCEKQSERLSRIRR